jgi:LmbE family N-acetylglucosaminyl deacetylase
MTAPGSGSTAGWPAPSGLPVGDLLAAGPVTTGDEVPRRVLAIGAHPDDVEFGCGATLARWAAQGCRLDLLVLTDGSKGTWDPDADPAALAAARRSECDAAAAVLAGAAGASVTHLGAVDGELEDSVANRDAVCRVVRTVRPDVVLAHDPWRRYRLHPDHRVAGFLSLGAVVAARDPHFFPGQGLEPHRPSRLYLYEPDLPNHVEDASGYVDVKVDALWCHASQHRSTMGVASDSDGAGSDGGRLSFAAKVAAQLASHGALAGLTSGEAFHRIDAI